MIVEATSAMFRLEFTPEAADDLRLYRKYDQQQIIDGIEIQLLHQADQETRNRKRLRPNQLAEWELRIGDFRVFTMWVKRTPSSRSLRSVTRKATSSLYIARNTSYEDDNRPISGVRNQ
jgi:mRNA-degrading endonuclease RelE of RelBE toxin-antitoxin system